VHIASYEETAVIRIRPLLTVLLLITGGDAQVLSSAAQEANGPSQRENAASERDRLAHLVAQEAASNGIPAELADAFVTVLSGYQNDAVGPYGEVGLMQLHLATAMMLGFRGEKKELSAPETNVRLGIAHLRRAWALARGDVCLTFLKYQTNYGEVDITPAVSAKCQQVTARLAELGSPLADTANARATSATAKTVRAVPTVPREAGVDTTPKEAATANHGQQVSEPESTGRNPEPDQREFSRDRAQATRRSAPAVRDSSDSGSPRTRSPRRTTSEEALGLRDTLSSDASRAAKVREARQRRSHMPARILAFIAQQKVDSSTTNGCRRKDIAVKPNARTITILRCGNRTAIWN
jgi:hypothetical protein